jgi:hypothetical protein
MRMVQFGRIGGDLDDHGVRAIQPLVGRGINVAIGVDEIGGAIRVGFDEDAEDVLQGVELAVAQEDDVHGGPKAKKEKTLVTWGLGWPGHASQSPKVFWFFFSKKNILP